MTTKSKQTGKLKTEIRRVILLLTMTAATLTVSAQQIVLKSKTQTRGQAIENIKAQGYNVIFNSRDLKEDATVNFGRTELPLKNVLDKVSEGTGLTYTVDGKHIIFYSAGATQSTSVVTVSTSRNIAGTVNDADGKPMEGVTVQLLGAAGKTAATFVNGRFLIEGVSSGNQILKLTSADGSIIRFREITVPTGKDADVLLSLEGATFVNVPAAIGEPAPRTPTKTTAYFVPNMADNTVHAFADEPKTNLFFVPESQVDWRGYMPKVAVKTNLLVWGTATPNVAIEFALARKWTMEIGTGYNPFQLEEGGINKVGYIQPEVRYWFCQRFEKHFVGLHGLYGQYNIGEVSFLTNTFEDNRYKGWAAGAGVSYGYHLPMGKRWAWEFTVGVGYVYLEYDQYRCYECDGYLGRRSKHYFGPTKAGISLMFMIK